MAGISLTMNISEAAHCCLQAFADFASKVQQYEDSAPPPDTDLFIHQHDRFNKWARLLGIIGDENLNAEYFWLQNHLRYHDMVMMSLRIVERKISRFGEKDDPSAKDKQPPQSSNSSTSSLVLSEESWVAKEEPNSFIERLMDHLYRYRSSAKDDIERQRRENAVSKLLLSHYSG